MAENQILPFAYADGANVLSQSDYQADNQRLIGHQPGVARSALENKALRQVSTMAAGLAQFIADGQAADVNDGKTPAEIAAMLLSAVTTSASPTVEEAAGIFVIRFPNTNLAIQTGTSTNNTTSPLNINFPYAFTRVYGFSAAPLVGTPGYVPVLVVPWVRNESFSFGFAQASGGGAAGSVSWLAIGEI